MNNIFLFTSLALSSISVRLSVDIVYTAPALRFIDHPPIIFQEASVSYITRESLGPNESA